MQPCDIFLCLSSFKRYRIISKPRNQEICILLMKFGLVKSARSMGENELFHGAIVGSFELQQEILLDCLRKEQLESTTIE
jgi:hypothetical protein